MSDTQKKYSYSRDGELYHDGFDTIEQAVREGATKVGERVWVGECVPPTQPEDWWSADDWIEHVSCQDEYCGDHAEAWDRSTKEQLSELEAEVKKIMAAWLDRHDLRPKFFNIINAKEYVISSIEDGEFVIEQVEESEVSP